MAGFSREATDALVGSILKRVDAFWERFGSTGEGSGMSFDTVYVGGGTPTAIPRPSIKALLNGLSSRVGHVLEWTVEANPESLDEEAIDTMLDSGVTRLSLGVQSLDDELLALLGRPARAVACERALSLAVSSGLGVSVDLMAALPRKTNLRSEASRLLDLGAGHLSVYDLVLEEGTGLAALHDSGKLELPGEDAAADERLELEAFLSTRGFRRYEVSNYSPPGSESLHNLAYWKMASYLGAGPGAVSTIAQAEPPGGALRIEESRNIATYLVDTAGEASETQVPPREAAFETIMMGFRTIFGVDCESFARRFGFPLNELIGATLLAWRERLVPAASRQERPGLPGSGSSPPRATGRDGFEDRALDGKGLNILNRFLVDCLAEIERNGRPIA